MKRLGFIVIVICIFSLMISCGQEATIDNEINAYLDNSLPSERTYFHEEEYTELFQEMYMLENLIKHEAYVVDNHVTFTFHLKRELTPSEVINVEGFFDQITFEQIPPIGGPLYGRAIYNLKPMDSVTYRIFIEEDLLQYQSFDLKNKQLDYYENMSLETNRFFKEDKEGIYLEPIERISFFIKNVEILKPYKGYVLYFDIDTYFSLNDKTVNEIKEVIEKEIGPALEERSVQRYGMNTNALGIVLNFKNEKNQQMLYLNGEEKKWLDANWQKYDFFNKN